MLCYLLLPMNVLLSSPHYHRMNERNELADMRLLPEMVYKSARKELPNVAMAVKLQRAASE